MQSSPGEITVTCNGINSGKVLLKVSDNTGEIYSPNTNSLIKGNNTCHLNLSYFGSGVYYLELNNGSQQKRSKFIFQK